MKTFARIENRFAQRRPRLRDIECYVDPLSPHYGVTDLREPLRDEGSFARSVLEWPM